MRDNHAGLIEFIEAFEKDGHHFVVIEKPFGDLMPGLKYRYFYAGSQKRHPEVRYSMQMRIELKRDSTQKAFEIPAALHANLLWFERLESPAEAEYLKAMESEPNEEQK